MIIKPNLEDKLHIFILAGGFGTRLKSIVSDVPKPMAPILNKPFLEYQINEVKRYFPDSKIYLLTHYLSELIEEYFKKNELITIIKEELPLGTGGSVKNAIKLLELCTNNHILLLNGDTYIKPNLKEVIDNTKNQISIVGSFQENCDRYGTLSIKGDTIFDFNEKKVGIKNSYINAGCYYFKNLNFFNNIKEEFFSIEDKLKEYLLKNTIDIFRYNGVFIDIGIPQDYNKMINYIEEENNANR